MSRRILLAPRIRPSGALLCLALASITAGRAAAQSRFELTPFIGSYLPLTDFGDVNQTPSSHSTFRQQIGVLAGARGRLYLSDVLGIEGSASYATSGWTETRSSSSGQPTVGFSYGGSITMLSARLTFARRRTNVYGILGAGYMNRGGDAWNVANWLPGTLYNTSNVSGILGAGLRAAASPKLLVDLTAELHLHNKGRIAQGFAQGSQPFHNAGLQSDLIVTAGIPIAFGSR
jgi:opacity protein-like surface antigen